MADNKKPINWWSFGLACVIRIIFWGLTIFIFILCFQSGNSFTTIHVGATTIACTLMMIEAILALSKDALLANIFSKRGIVRIHWMLQFLGLEMVVVGAAAIFYDKMQDDIPHFTTAHGKMGLIVTIFSVCIGIAAVPALHTKFVPNVIGVDRFRRGHIYLAVIALIFLWIVQLTGFYTPWWTASNTLTYVAMTAYVIGGFCLLAKPVYGTLMQSIRG